MLVRLLLHPATIHSIPVAKTLQRSPVVSPVAKTDPILTDIPVRHKLARETIWLQLLGYSAIFSCTRLFGYFELYSAIRLLGQFRLFDHSTVKLLGYLAIFAMFLTMLDFFSAMLGYVFRLCLDIFLGLWVGYVTLTNEVGARCHSLPQMAP